MKSNCNDTANEAVLASTYGMSSGLRESGLLSVVRDLSHEDKSCLIRYIHETEDSDIESFEEMYDEKQPYTIEELNARIDEAEEGMERNEGKTYEEMMNGFREKLLWLK